MLKNSRIDSTAIMPDCSQAAEKTALAGANDPVCDMTALCPCALRPAFMSTIGLFLVISEASLINLGPSDNLSTYISMALVSSSSLRYSRNSISVRDASFPKLMNLEKPTPSSNALSKTAVPSAPDCERKAIWPFCGESAANEAFSLVTGFNTPRQFGPKSAMLFFLAISLTLFSSSIPAGPISLKPA